MSRIGLLEAEKVRRIEGAGWITGATKHSYMGGIQSSVLQHGWVPVLHNNLLCFYDELKDRSLRLPNNDKEKKIITLIYLDTLYACTEISYFLTNI